MILAFHAHLKPLLHRVFRNQQLIDHDLHRRASIKDVIESFGVPHTEIGRILVNGQEVSFAHIPDNSTKIDIFPLDGPHDFLNSTPLRAPSLVKIIFALDINIGKLVNLLRMAGIDTFYTNPISEFELLEVAAQENRILLSKNRNLLKRKKVTHGYLVKNILPEQQFMEVIIFFELKDKMEPFTRCMACNGLLQEIDKKRIIERLEPLTKIYYHTFQQCVNCTKLYWPGSHKDKMVQFFKRCFPDYDFSAKMKD